MKYDQAYCSQVDDKLSIYEVRDLNFDENVDYDSDKSIFSCPDDECRSIMGNKAKLSIVNAKKRKYIKTPHFKDMPSTAHRKNCPYGNLTEATSIKPPESTHIESEKEHNFPTEFIPTRKKYVTKLQKTSPHESSSTITKVTNSKTHINKSRGKRQNKTSVLEHIVECYVSNIDDKEKLKSTPLTISELTLTYWRFFKKIQYFQDGEGLIYWGRIKHIKDYKYSFRIDFTSTVDGKRVCLYIKKNVIDSYRKKKIFLEEIREAMSIKEEKYCFFFGIYPQIKTVEFKEETFEVYNADVTNIDHVLIRTI